MSNGHEEDCPYNYGHNCSCLGVSTSPIPSRAGADELVLDKLNVRSDTKHKDGTPQLKRGDIVVNGYASPGVNDLHVIVGTVSIKTSKYSTTPTYKTRCLFKGKLTENSQFYKRDHKLTKIGHVDYEAFIKQAMQDAYVEWAGSDTPRSSEHNASQRTSPKATPVNLNQESE